MQSWLKGWKTYTMLTLIKKISGCINIRQSRSQDKECYQGEKIFYNNGVNSSRRYNSKHLYPYNRASKYTKQKQNAKETFSNPQMSDISVCLSIVDRTSRKSVRYRRL